jgi:hypothetical protein
MKKKFTAFIAVAAMMMAMVAPAQAESFWEWSYSNDNVTASGVLSVTGDASSPESVATFSGQRNGDTITGLVPLGTDSGRFLYDNMFTSATPQVSWYGILFNVAGAAEHVNLYFDQGTYREVSYFGTGSPVDNAVSFQVSQVSAVPEPETLAMLLLGLGLVGYVTNKRKQFAPTKFA